MKYFEHEFRPSTSQPANHDVLVAHGFHPGEPNMERLQWRMIQLTAANRRQLRRPTEEGPAGRLVNTTISPEDWKLKRRLFDGKENLTQIEPNEFGSRAQQRLARYCLRAKKYSIAIHPHGALMPDSDMAIYGATASPLTKQVASYLGMSRAIVSTHGVGIALPNSLGLEIGTNSPLLDFDMMYEKIAALTTHTEDLALPQTPLIDEYIYIGDLTTKTAEKYGLQTSYEPLEPLTPHDAEVFYRALGSDAVELVALFWDGLAHDAIGFRGEVMARYPLPSSYPLSEHKMMVV